MRLGLVMLAVAVSLCSVGFAIHRSTSISRLEAAVAYSCGLTAGYQALAKMDFRSDELSDCREFRRAAVALGYKSAATLYERTGTR
jgi:hypothetical protein